MVAHARTQRPFGHKNRRVCREALSPVRTSPVGVNVSDKNSEDTSGCLSNGTNLENAPTRHRFVPPSEPLVKTTGKDVRAHVGTNQDHDVRQCSAYRQSSPLREILFWVQEETETKSFLES